MLPKTSTDGKNIVELLAGYSEEQLRFQLNSVYCSFDYTDKQVYETPLDVSSFSLSTGYSFWYDVVVRQITSLSSPTDYSFSSLDQITPLASGDEWCRSQAKPKF
jgi:hypothetical protein